DRTAYPPDVDDDIILTFDLYAQLPELEPVNFRITWYHYPFVCPESGEVGWSPYENVTWWYTTTNPFCGRVTVTAQDYSAPLDADLYRVAIDVIACCDCVGTTCTDQSTNITPIFDNVRIGLVTAHAQGTTHVVNPEGTGDYATVQNAIDAAENGDTIELTDGTYTGTGNTNINVQGKAITIRSQSRGAENCIIDCQGSAANQCRGFIFNSGEDSTTVLNGITIRNGYELDGAAIICTDLASSPTISDCILEYNTATDDGGAIYCSHGSSPTMQGCHFDGNQAVDKGGAVCCTESTPLFEDCVFTNNASTGNDGGGLYSQFPGETDVRRCIFDNNTAGDNGGAVYVRDEFSLNLSDCVITNNTASHLTGGVYSYNQCLLEILGCTIVGNGAGDAGGVSCYDSSQANIVASIIAFSSQGSAVYCSDGWAVVTCCDIYGNDGGDYVGCIGSYEGFEGNISSDPLFCDIGNGEYTLREDSPCAEDNNAECGQVGAYGVGCEASTGVDPAWDTADRIVLDQILPNPTSSGISVAFDLPRSCPIDLAVVNVQGRLVKRLVNERWTAGHHTATWDCTASNGKRVTPGVYFVRLAVSDVVMDTRSVIVMD
ncbi:hypothetical protein ACFL6M_07655, partial [Candidatus Eisenbacteria bacterium]